MAAGPPGISVPPLVETSSQEAELASVQVKELVPVLVTEKFCVVMVNGPLNPPMEVKPPDGVMRRDSGFASALIKFWPTGVPHPVQRSSPFTAENLVGLLGLSLL